MFRPTFKYSKRKSITTALLVSVPFVFSFWAGSNVNEDEQAKLAGNKPASSPAPVVAQKTIEPNSGLSQVGHQSNNPVSIPNIVKPSGEIGKQALPKNWSDALKENVISFNHPDNDYWRDQVKAHEAQARTPGWLKFEAYTVSNKRDVLALPTFKQMSEAPRSENYLIVRLAEGASLEAIEALGLNHDTKLGGDLVDNLHRYTVSGKADFEQLLESSNAHSAVIYAEPDYTLQEALVPSDPNITATDWWLDQINAYEAWDIATDASAIGPIAIFDNGILKTHEDLVDNLWVNTDEIAGNGIDDDSNGFIDDINGITVSTGRADHGTPVSGTVCGQGANGVGYVGTVWRCQLMELQSSLTLSGAVSDYSIAMSYAVNEGARISNHSWRILTFSMQLADITDGLEHIGHLVVAAAGNEYSDIDAGQISYPARLPNDNVLTVAASTFNESKISYSNWGATSVDLAAPTGFATADESGGYSGFSGTSQATPVVTGAVALAWSQNPSLSYLEIKQKTMDSTRPVTAWTGLTVTGGILDVEALLESVIFADTDGDGIMDSSDPDDDNDGVLDEIDAFPRDVTEWLDSDDDGVGDNSDAFSSNGAESKDSDGDGIGDRVDVFPHDPQESTDSDGDGIGDNSDVFPFDPSRSVDTDHDGIDDHLDADIDGDGIPNFIEESNGLNARDISDGAMDLDNDGWSNADEYRFGSAINDADNHPASTSQRPRQKVFASDGKQSDFFANQVVMSGDTALIGAYANTDNGPFTGTAYIYQRNAEGVWIEQQELVASQRIAQDAFGVSVSLDGDIAVVGAHGFREEGGFSQDGAVLVFERSEGIWSERQIIRSTGREAWFGGEVAISGGTLLISAKDISDLQNTVGVVYAFERIDDLWVEQQRLSVSDVEQSNGFGNSLSLEGDTALIGANRDSDLAERAGAAYVFVRENSVWSLQQKLLPSDGQTQANFGLDVSLSGDTALIGSIGARINHLPYVGAAYIFTRSAGVWSEQQKLQASDAARSGQFGVSVALHGNVALIGANAPFSNRAGAYLFVNQDGIWEEQEKLALQNPAYYVGSYIDVALSDNTALAGDYLNMDLGYRAGIAYFFDIGDLNREVDADSDGLADTAENGRSRVNTSVPITGWTLGSDLTSTGNSIVFNQDNLPGIYGRQANSPRFSSLGIADGAEVSWRLQSNADEYAAIVGLGITESGEYHSDIDYGFWVEPGFYGVIENGNFVDVWGGANNNTLFSIEVDGPHLNYKVDGITVSSTTLSGSPDFYIDTAFYGQAVTLSHVVAIHSGEGRLITDADGDGIDNRLDLDSDNDSIPDVIEIGLMDSNGDFVVDNPELQGIVTVAPDSDGDGLPNHLDLESLNPANDGTAYDIAAGPFVVLDTNGDGRVDTGDAGGGIDTDNNGVDDLIERLLMMDTDGDGVPDNLDAFPNDPTETADTDGDGVGDNADAFPNDASETQDSDGIGDNTDIDADNDGLSNSAEAGSSGPINVTNWTLGDDLNLSGTNSVTFNHNNLPGIYGRQANSPRLSALGVSGAAEFSWNVLAASSEFAAVVGLGITELNEHQGDVDYGFWVEPGLYGLIENGTFVGIWDIATDNTLFAIEVNGSNLDYKVDGEVISSVTLTGNPDFYLDTAFYGGSAVLSNVVVTPSGGTISADSDGDGIENRLDLDSDNDSIPDVIEAGLVDADGNYIVDVLGDQGSVTTAPDSDGDGIPDYLDLESLNAANDGTAYDIDTGIYAVLDTNNDGQLNASDTGGGIDANGNGVDDLIEP